MSETSTVWPRKTRELMNHHMDSTIWNDFEFRDDDIVVATYAKSGTTWTQQIVGQLVFKGDEDVAVHDISPWLDLRVPPAPVKLGMLQAQTHRRIVKTHLPLDALVFSPKAKYLYIGRDGRDVLFSFHHHHSQGNALWYELLNDTPGRVGPPMPPPDPDVRRYFLTWLEQDGYPIWSLWENVATWWAARDLPNVKLVHFNQLKADLPGEMRAIAEFLEIDVPEARWDAIIEHCGFDYMKAHAERVAPLGGAVFDGGAETFINKGVNGRWRDVLSAEDSAAYEATALERLGPECARWLMTGERASAGAREIQMGIGGDVNGAGPRRARSVAEMGELQMRMGSPDSVPRSIESYRPRPTDIVISPYGKCGTTWLQQTFHTLRTRGDLDFDDISRVVPWIETAGMLGLDLEAPQRAEPRGFKSHLSYDQLPKGARYVVSLRDPKDALVSMYRFMEGWFLEPGAVSIGEFFTERWMQGGAEGGGYWSHLISWWEQRDNPDVLLFSYEHMTDDPQAHIRRLAAFCGIPLDDALLALTSERSSLAFMLRHKDRFDDFMMRTLSEARCNLPSGSDSAKVRKGGVGGHRDELPDDVSAALDAMWAAQVTPKLGFANYAELEAALRRRQAA